VHAPPDDDGAGHDRRVALSEAEPRWRAQQNRAVSLPLAMSLVLIREPHLRAQGNAIC